VVDLVQQTLVLVQGVSQTQDVYQTHVVAVPLCQSPQALAQMLVGYLARWHVWEWWGTPMLRDRFPTGHMHLYHTHTFLTHDIDHTYSIQRHLQ